MRGCGAADEMLHDEGTPQEERGEVLASAKPSCLLGTSASRLHLSRRGLAAAMNASPEKSDNAARVATERNS